jgi:hypothetical protein
VVRNNRENRKQRRRKVMPEQAEEGRMQWICVGPQSLLQNGDKTLTAGGTKNEDCVKGSSLAYRLLFLQPCFRYVKLYTYGASK